MRLATYRAADGAPRVGAVVDAGSGRLLVDLAHTGLGEGITTVQSLVCLGPELLQRTAAIELDPAIGVPLEDVALLAPIARPPKLIAAAANYPSHIAEAGIVPPAKANAGIKLFLKPSSCVIGPGAPLTLPRLSHTVDWEIELAAVVGVHARDVAAEEALGVIAGYTIINDVSARSIEWGDGHGPSADDGFFEWLAGKWFDGFAPMGPWMVTADEIDDPQRLSLGLRLNGEIRQQSSTAEMIFSVAELVSHASRFMTLEPGDVIATGTPAGVGDVDGRYLADGDVMLGWVERIGELATVAVEAR